MPKVNNGISTAPSNNTDFTPKTRKVDEFFATTNNTPFAEQPKQFAESSKSNPLNLRTTHANIKHHNVSIGDGFIQRKLFSFLEFLRDIFKLTKSWLGIASPKPEPAPFYIEKQIVRHDGSSRTTFSLTNNENAKFAKEVTVLHDILLTTPLSPKDWPEDKKCQFIKDFSRNGIEIENNPNFTKDSLDANKHIENHISNLIPSLENELINLCNQDEFAAEVLTRFLNQQIARTPTEFFSKLPIGKDQDSGYRISTPDLKLTLNKIKKPKTKQNETEQKNIDSIKIIVNMTWPSKTKNFEKDIFKLNTNLDLELHPDLTSEISEINYNFEMEFAPPPKDLNKNYKNVTASDYLTYMTLTKGLTIEVHKNGGNSLASQNVLTEDHQDELYAPEESTAASSVHETQNLSSANVDGNNAASNALHFEESEESRKTK